MKTDLWMPFYIGDYLADTMHLDREHHGSYLLLIMAYWRNGGPLKDDMRLLCAISKCTHEKWEETRAILSEFFDISDGFWRHKRVDFELKKASNNQKARVSAGTKGAYSRWQTDGKGNGKRIDLPIAKPMRSQWQNDAPSPSPSPSDNKDIGKNESSQVESDEEWIAGLCLSPAYVGIDVKLQYEKMIQWCKVTGNKPTRRRFINWLNKCEKPMTATVQKLNGNHVDKKPSIWEMTKSLEAIEERLNQIVSYGAGGAVDVQPKDRAEYDKLRINRKQLKESIRMSAVV